MLRLHRRLRPLGAVLASSFLSLGVALGVGEGFFRLTREPIDLEALRKGSIDYQQVAYARHALPRQSQEIRLASSGGRGASIGPRGYRGRDFVLPKPAGIIRVVILGGSAAFDPHAPADRDWPRQVEGLLRERGFGSVEVINAGTPGHSTADSLGRFFSEIWMLEPDWVVVYHCWNDLKYFSWLGPERSLLRGVEVPPTHRGSDRVWNPLIHDSGPVERLLSRSQLYLRLKRRYWEWRLGLIGPEGLLVVDAENERRRRRGEGLPDRFDRWGPQQFELDLRLLVAASRLVGAEPVLLTQARLVAEDQAPANVERLNLAYLGLSHAGAVRAFAACDDAIAEVAQTERVAWLDVSAQLSGRSELFEDHVHLSEAGTAELAVLVADFMAERLEPSLRRTAQR